jgi:hypothetical protein
MADLLESIKSIYEIAKKIGNKDLIIKIGEMEILLSDMRVAYAALQDENLLLKEKIRLLTEHPLTLKNGIFFDNDGYPFCPVCYGKERHRIPLQKRKSWHSRNGVIVPAKLHCHNCSYETEYPNG